MSGLWFIKFVHSGPVPIESGYGVRQLARCFGAVEGSGDLREKVVGQEIYFSTDEFGIFAGFTPTDEWTGPELEFGDEMDDEDALMAGLES
jgi:hypothetical protein